MQDVSTKIVEAPLTLILYGSSSITNNIANKGGQYFDYELPPLHSPWILDDAKA